MNDKNALANDWEKIGDDMRVAMGLMTRELDTDAIRNNNRYAFIKGILSINLVGNNKSIFHMLPIFKESRVNQR